MAAWWAHASTSTATSLGFQAAGLTHLEEVIGAVCGVRRAGSKQRRCRGVRRLPLAKLTGTQLVRVDRLHSLRHLRPRTWL
jgi:RecB family endonuclease NucS